MQSQRLHRNLATHNLQQAFSASDIAYLLYFEARKQETLLCRYNKAPTFTQTRPDLPQPRLCLRNIEINRYHVGFDH